VTRRETAGSPPPAVSAPLGTVHAEKSGKSGLLSRNHSPRSGTSDRKTGPSKRLRADRPGPALMARTALSGACLVQARGDDCTHFSTESAGNGVLISIGLPAAAWADSGRVDEMPDHRSHRRLLRLHQRRGAGIATERDAARSFPAAGPPSMKRATGVLVSVLIPPAEKRDLQQVRCLPGRFDVTWDPPTRGSCRRRC
jgi:hypothetical protein